MIRFLPGIGVVLALSLSLAGCFARDPLERCQDVREYQASGSIPPFQSPEGLEQPPGPQRFAIPGAASGPAQPPAGRCLEMPPDFFGRPVGSTGAPPAPAPQAP